MRVPSLRSLLVPDQHVDGTTQEPLDKVPSIRHALKHVLVLVVLLVHHISLALLTSLYLNGVQYITSDCLRSEEYLSSREHKGYPCKHPLVRVLSEDPYK